MSRSCALPRLISSAVKTSAPQTVTISPALIGSLAKVPLPPSGEGIICSRGSNQAVFLYSLIESYAKDNSQGDSFFEEMSDVRRQMSAKKPLASPATDTRHLAPEIYSNLSATIGSTFVARRAGTQ